MPRTFSSKSFTSKTFSSKTFSSKAFVSYDSDAQTFFNQLPTQPGNTMKENYNTLFNSLKGGSNNFAKHDRLYIRGSEYQDNALISLPNPTSTATTEVNSPSWVQYQGYTGAATKYLNLNYTPSSSGVNFTTNSACVWGYSRTNLNAGYAIGVAQAAGNESSIAPRLSGDFYGSMNDAIAHDTFVASANSLGLFSCVRTNANTVQLWKNGVLVATDTFASGAKPTISMFELGLNLDGSLFGSYAGNVFASGIGSGTIDQAELYTSIQNFATLLGVQV